MTSYSEMKNRSTERWWTQNCARLLSAKSENGKSTKFNGGYSRAHR